MTKKMKKWTRRSFMSCLFLLALLSTYSSISGVDAKTMASFFNKQAEKFESSHSIQNAIAIALAVKVIHHAVQDHGNLFTEETVPASSSKLEEFIDWTKFPKKTVTATGYTAGYESTGKNLGHPEFGITFSGVKVKRDLFSTIAADLDVFPIGTILFIPGYGYGVVADKGGAIRGDEIDLYYETVDEVYNEWGKRTLEVYIIEMGDGSLTENKLTELNEDEELQVFRQQYIRTEKK